MKPNWKYHHIQWNSFSHAYAHAAALCPLLISRYSYCGIAKEVLIENFHIKCSASLYIQNVRIVHPVTFTDLDICS